MLSKKIKIKKEKRTLTQIIRSKQWTNGIITSIDYNEYE